MTHTFFKYFIFFYGYLAIAMAQNQVKLDSLKHKLDEDSIKIFKTKKLLPILTIDTRNSLISTAKIQIQGLQLGIVFKESDVAGIGAYLILLPFKIKDHPQLYNLDVKYATAFYQKLLIDKRYHELDVMIEVGVGQYKTYSKEPSGVKLVKQGPFNPIGLTPVYIFKPTKWIGIQLMAGYRWMLQQELYNTFSQPFYSVGLWLSVKDFIRFLNYDISKKKIYRQEVKKILSEDNH